MIRRNTLVVLSQWSGTFLAFILIGYFFATTGLMGDLSRESAESGRDPLVLASEPKYAGLYKESENNVSIMVTYIFPLMAALTGALVGFLCTRRVLVTASVSLGPIVLFPFTTGFRYEAAAQSLAYLFLGSVVAWLVRRARAEPEPALK